MVYSRRHKSRSGSMSRTAGFLTSLAFIAASAPGTALAGGAFFGFGGGSGDVSFDDATFGANRFITDDSLVGELFVGYRLDSKVVVEGGASLGLSLDSLIFSDFFTLDETRVMAGYAFQPGERVSIVPKLGVSFWRLDSEDGAFSFFGSQRVDFDDSGSDLIWRVSVEWRLAQRFHLYGAYSDAHYDFGDSSGPSFGCKFQF
jgi:hypothetical protein